MKNKLVDLNNHLFAQLERLSDEALRPEQLEREVRRAAAMVAVSNQIIRNAEVCIQAVRLGAENGGRFKDSLPMIEGTKP